MKRELPVYNIEGTDFEVDVVNLQLRQKANPGNVISLSDMRDVGDGYVFEYSPKEKNIPILFTDDVLTVKILELVQLDPAGMAQKYDHPLATIHTKTDFDLMVDQQAFSRRLMGHLPTLDIAGQIFFVDIRMDMLRPKDDFLSSGISFSEIDHYYDDMREEYIIPYNYKTHEFQEVDHTMTTIPPEVMIVSFPHESRLDPVGVNRSRCMGEKDGLKEVNLKSHFEAKLFSWKESGFIEAIKENIREQKKQQQSQQHSESHKAAKRQRRGPRL